MHLKLLDFTGACAVKYVILVPLCSCATVENLGFVWEEMFRSVCIGHFSVILLCLRSFSGSEEQMIRDTYPAGDA